MQKEKKNMNMLDSAGKYVQKYAEYAKTNAECVISREYFYIMTCQQTQKYAKYAIQYA
jgi:hypothetical protein